MTKTVTEQKEHFLCRVWFIGHKFGEWEYVDDNSCEQVRVCTRDGYEQKRKAHQFGAWVGDVRVCKRCDHREEQDVPYWSGEQAEYESGKCKTCLGYGPAIGVCDECGARPQTT